MRLASLLFLTAFFFASGARGQTGPAAYADRAGGTQSDAASAVVADEQGNVVVVGTIDGTASFGSISVTVDETGCVFSTCHDAFVARYAADGTALWVRRMGTPVHNDFATDVDIHGPTGDILVSGYFTGVATWDGGDNPDIGLTTRSDFDAFLARYTASGDLMWVVQGGGTDQDTGRSVALDFQGDVYWSGGFRGTATFGEGANAVTLTSDGSSDGFVARVTREGAIDWIRQVGGVESATVYGVSTGTFTESDFLAITGSFSGVALLDGEALQSRGADDAFVARLNLLDGGVDWAAQAGGNEGDQGRAVTISTVTGEIVVVGWFSGQIVAGSDVLTSAGSTDILIAAFNRDGSEAWGRHAGGDGFDIATNVHSAPLSDIVTRGPQPERPPLLVTGYVDGSTTFTGASGETIQVNAQGRDGFLATYTLGGEIPGQGAQLQSAVALGGTSQDSGAGITSTRSSALLPPDEGQGGSLYLVVAGTFGGTATLFGETVTSAGSNDIFLAKRASCPGVYCYVNTASGESPEASGVGIAVFPHPATRASTLTVTLGTPAALLVEVYDARGRRVATLADDLHAAGDHPFALPPLAPGTYLVRAVTPEAVVSRTVVVAR